MACLLSGCHTTNPSLTRGSDAIESTGIADPELVRGSYRISPADEVKVDVIYEPELSLSARKVDPNGNILVPLIGSVRAAGKTADELTAEIRQQMVRYVRNPQVVVTITDYARQAVTVEGSVELPGVYPIPGTSSLLQALALARGPKNTAKLGEVIVFRTVDGHRAGAVFDLNRIRHGYEQDPLILGGDIVVVGFSELKGAYRDFLSAAPTSGSFRSF
ncbi:MAG: polysaccharide biosynthesis/export family protein [Croceibacterium sp.]